ncbi:hypothetical protein ACIG87_24455 [Micromonospora sp. NPDC051925]|uniref:hypothetical protein n=1 Tax=Micromonospora sp. NPDC051925 TaxID=3364288 RepID=UPI0037C83930
MKDLEQLSVLDPARGREPTAAEWARSNALVDRIVDGRAVHTASVRRPARRRWAIGLVAAGAAAVVGAVTVPSLLPGSLDRAFASWTPVPGSLTGEQVMPQARRCAESGVGDGGSGPVSPSDVILAEQRGVATLLILRRGAGTIECMSLDGGRPAAMTLTDGPLPVPANGTVKVETYSSVGSDDEQYSSVVGLAGPSVTGVDLVFADGRTIQTSTRGGWWAAWWPGPEGGEVGSITVVVHSTTGTATHPIEDL